MHQAETWAMLRGIKKVWITRARPDWVRKHVQKGVGRSGSQEPDLAGWLGGGG